MKIRVLLGVFITLLFVGFTIYKYIDIVDKTKIIDFTNKNLPSYNIYMNSINQQEIKLDNNYSINSGTLVSNLTINGQFHRLHFNSTVGFTVKHELNIKNTIINMGNIIEFANTGDVKISNSVLLINDNSLLINGRSLSISDSVIIGEIASDLPLVEFKSKRINIKNSIFIDKSKLRKRGSLFLTSDVNLYSNLFVSHLYKFNSPLVLDNLTGDITENIIYDQNPYNRVEFIGEQDGSGEYIDPPELIEGRIGIISFKEDVNVSNNLIIGEVIAYCPLTYSKCLKNNKLKKSIDLKKEIKKRVHHSLLPHIGTLTQSL